MALFTVLHWLVPQGVYFVLAFPYDADANLVYGEKASAPAMPYMSLICAVALLGALDIMIISVSFRRLKSAIYLAGTCGAARSAACRPPKNVHTETMAHGELMWGETDLPWALKEMIMKAMAQRDIAALPHQKQGSLHWTRYRPRSLCILPGCPYADNASMDLYG